MGEKKERKAFFLVGGLILILFISCIGLLIWQYCGGRTGNTACIYQEGVLVKTLSLDQDTTFVLENADGCSNTIEVRDGRIGITQADCPNQLCIRMGFTKSRLIPITCLPNRVLITVEEREEASDGVDAVAY